MKEQTGFADVDGSGRSGELVGYLMQVAQHVGDFRRQGYELMRLAPGDTVLDVGCGAGEVCVELAAIVGPRGRVAGVDLSEAMVEAARHTVAASAMSVELRTASIYELPFADGAFDAVRAERVFQHLDHPEAALREMLRVTKPGGRVMLSDPDHGQAGLALDDPVHRRIYEALQRAMTKMIVNPHSGTRLRGMLLRAGLGDVAQLVNSFTFDHPQFMRMFFVSERLAAATAAGEITDGEGAEFVAALGERHRAGTFFGSAIGYTVAGTKR
jgi:ubiquinone/menaquinone biosynthesis C-methylase UbiE